VAILAGGLATRLGPLTRAVPKSLVPVAGRPFVDHQLAWLARAGLRRVVFCLGHLGEQVEAHVGDGGRFGLEVRYSHDGPQLLGTGGALRRALPLLGEAFWVLYGDSYLDVAFQEVLDHFLAAGRPALMTVVSNDGAGHPSNALFKDGKLVAYSKTAPAPEMAHIDYGLSLLRREAVERLAPARSHDLAELFGDLAAEGRLTGHEVFRRFHEVGSPAGLAEAERFLQARGA
jgi:NDP-sugar pyrophosphorylase family protein